MSLRWKLQLVVIAILAIMALVGLAVERCAVLPRFTSLERQEAEAENAFVKKAVEHELRALHSTCCDWARWDDPYLFVAGRNPGWPAADLQPDAIATLRLDLMYICGLEGRRHWSLALDPVTGRPGTLPDFPATGLPASHPLLTEPTADGHTGIWTTRWGPMLVAAVPITTSDRESPFNGVLIMGRVLTEALVAAMPTCDGMEVRARGVGDLSWSLQEQAIAERLGAGTGSVVDEVSADRVACYSVLPDLAGKPALMLKAEIPRDATQTGRAAERLFFLAILAALIALIPATLLVLRRMVVDPITALVHHAVKVGQTSDLSARLASRRSDEIGVLAREFDAMLERMADARARLLSRSYRSGMAEGMTGTLHGVRNALTPAVVSVAEAREQLRAARPEWIAAAARELARTDLNESRREDLNAYVQLAGTRLLDVMSGVEDAVSEVDQHLARIERMLPLPDALEAEPLIEPFGFAEVVPEALGSLRPELRSLLQLDLAPDLSTVAPVLGVKTTTEQILANVLANAVEARGQDNGSVARVRLTARLTEDSGRRMVDLLVADNGLGIAPRDIDRVFENGFSTKPDHSGLGLHWCANAAHAMGGRMYAENPESGGATFHVLLPAADEAQREQPQC